MNSRGYYESDSRGYSKSGRSEYPQRNSRERYNQRELCYSCGEEGHKSRECNNARCYACGLFGHISRDCEKNIPPRDKNRSGSSPGPHETARSSGEYSRDPDVRKKVEFDDNK